jgi:hypothetical protein
MRRVFGRQVRLEFCLRFMRWLFCRKFLLKNGRFDERRMRGLFGRKVFERCWR